MSPGIGGGLRWAGEKRGQEALSKGLGEMA